MDLNGLIRCILDQLNKFFGERSKGIVIVSFDWSWGGRLATFAEFSLDEEGLSQHFNSI